MRESGASSAIGLSQELASSSSGKHMEEAKCRIVPGDSLISWQSLDLSPNTGHWCCDPTVMPAAKLQFIERQVYRRPWGNQAVNGPFDVSVLTKLISAKQTTFLGKQTVRLG